VKRINETDLRVLWLHFFRVDLGIGRHNLTPPLQLINLNRKSNLGYVSMLSYCFCNLSSTDSHAVSQREHVIVTKHSYSIASQETNWRLWALYLHSMLA